MDDNSLSLSKSAAVIGCSVNSLRKIRAKMKEEADAEIRKAKEKTEDDWIDDMLEKESSFWKDIPAPRKKRDDDIDEIMELLDDLE